MTENVKVPTWKGKTLNMNELRENIPGMCWLSVMLMNVKQSPADLNAFSTVRLQRLTSGQLE